jgi:hypothetical protein
MADLGDAAAQNIQDSVGTLRNAEGANIDDINGIRGKLVSSLILAFMKRGFLPLTARLIQAAGIDPWLIAVADTGMHSAHIGQGCTPEKALDHPCGPWRFPALAEGRPLTAIPGGPTPPPPWQKGQFAEGALPAGDASVRNLRKAVKWCS